MTDLFALLEEVRRPWLDPAELKVNYHRLTARHHPDVAGASGDFAEINRAYQTLSDPAGRLRHLLELESPAGLSPAQTVPADIASFFTSVAEANQEVDAFFRKNAASASPLAKALLSSEQHQVREHIEEVIAALQQQYDLLLSQLRNADALWFTDRVAAVRLLPDLWQSLGYITKWLASLRESLFRLASL